LTGVVAISGTASAKTIVTVAVDVSPVDESVMV